MFSKRVKHYQQWLRSAIPFKAKLDQISSDSVRVQGPTKRPSLGYLYPVPPVKERYRKGRQCKISRVLQSPVPSTQASPKVEASHRLKQAQHFSTRRKVQNGNSRVHQDLPDSRGVGSVDRPVGRLPAYPHPPKLKEIPKVLLQGSGVPVHLPPVRTSHSPPGLYHDRKGGETNGPLKRTQNSPIPGRLADQVPVSGGSPNEHSGSSRTDSVLGVDNKSGKIRTETYTGVLVRGLRIPPKFSPCKTHSREMAQTSGFDPTTQVKTCFDCKMFDVSNWVASLNGENGPGGTPSHEALSVSPQGALEISSVAGQPPSLDRSHCSPPRLVAKSLQCDERCRPSSQRPQYPATLSSWLKQTILLCYKQADQQALDLVQVKAHDIRAFAASKAFYGGVSVDQIMQACHWKAHNTFTNFYLKDLTWSDTDNNLYLGPVVAAQQVLDPSPQTSCPRKEKRGGGGGHIRYNQVFRSLSQDLGIPLPSRCYG